eukprot:CAMPEP_0175920784 /NCGR_PEP_ID=MMETSP0108-20121206/13112_1 /TAXON_ID=195067 ORGANISM="Goniomonas pacifica, Strain CCMP1869" /NCGR_SAMPLE_ID=MMETSP0108 /ASSEMBLY_ACC=CAM_ASM_000204 /LENGTH=88 /DNA_ID=CAMNT_0017243521 /DNA_START=149 /DNA_END=415 /DNA_ORIENTATION=-
MEVLDRSLDFDVVREHERAMLHPLLLPRLASQNEYVRKVILAWHLRGFNLDDGGRVLGIEDNAMASLQRLLRVVADGHLHSAQAKHIK